MSFIDKYESLAWSDIDDKNSFPTKRPILAHYTTISTIESILRNKEIWLSHPLLMNDFEEMRWGITEGSKQFVTNDALRKACKTSARHQKLVARFEDLIAKFSTSDSRDIYISCFCEHKKDDEDGLLSMWRAYGANGGGAALIVDTARLTPAPDSPLVLHPITYSSTENRIKWISQKLDELSKLITHKNPTNEELAAASETFFERLKLFSIFTKHIGFEEENEWRLAYIGDRDNNKTYKPMISYAILSSGIQPKLKLKLDGVSNDIQANVTDIVTHILLGPTASAPLSVMAMQLMLQSIDKGDLAEGIKTCSTPYRV